MGRKSGNCLPFRHGTSSEKQVPTGAPQTEKAEKIIAVMGQSGSGKADLIRQLARNSWQRPDRAHPHRVTAIEVDVRNVRVTLLNTPDVGKNSPEAVIACYLREWLQQSGAHLTGILYFQDLDDRRVIRLNLDCFRDLCEVDEVYPTVLLVATGKRSIMHKELQDGEWKNAVGKGAKTYVYMNTKESAEEAIRHVVACS
ncbi:hypothetical protein F5J12DRAFT_783613 [Pisolithus orientalis]|uniref:uncharacterized protein n=1 Tax=Pisolithus orientalis TaxID=936130 RepID=UPI002224D6AF|nr:uncharacterized protein F5J12DRAFT_783613 [Pisolithus orientalis]KAI6003167.1 hypothetical protein F5J12DRAFT_783613 [Pisolithus orientalis]